MMRGTHVHAVHAVHLALALVVLCSTSAQAAPSTVPDLPDHYSAEVARLKGVLSSSAPEHRLEGIEGLKWLRHWPSEGLLLRLTADADPLVRREATHAIARLGTARSVPRLIRLLQAPREEISLLAWSGLQRMTAQRFARDRPDQWRDWWAVTPRPELIAILFDQARDAERRRPALTALGHLAGPEDEERMLGFVQTPQTPPLRGQEWTLCFDVLERIGGEQSRPLFLKAASLAPAAFALGRLGGKDAEEAMLAARKSEAVWINLDRLHSRKCGRFAVPLLSSFGLISYRSRPDDVHLEPTPMQRVAANLLRRSGEAPKLVDLLLSELEGKSKAESAPDEIKKLLIAMRPELRPGFHRADGWATSMALGALPHLAAEPECAPRLIALLEHEAVVPRVYAALTLGAMQAEEAVPPLLKRIDEPYPFSDSTALASGKHFAHSKTVRWKGFLCMALGRLGGEAARAALERLATDSSRPRDVRFGAVVGLGFIRSPASLPALEAAAREDVVFMVREKAKECCREIALQQGEGAP